MAHPRQDWLYLHYVRQPHEGSLFKPEFFSTVKNKHSVGVLTWLILTFAMTWPSMNNPYSNLLILPTLLCFNFFRLPILSFLPNILTLKHFNLWMRWRLEEKIRIQMHKELLRQLMPPIVTFIWITNHWIVIHIKRNVLPGLMFDILFNIKTHYY